MDPVSLFEKAEIVLIAEYQNDVSTTIKYDASAYTTSEFTIKKVLKNTKNYNLGQTILATYRGGNVSVQELLNSRDESFKQKLGLSNEKKILEVQDKYVKFTREDIGDSDLSHNKKRVLFLNYNNTTNDYQVLSDNYGMPSYNETNAKIFDSQSKEMKKYGFLN